MEEEVAERGVLDVLQSAASAVNIGVVVERATVKPPVEVQLASVRTCRDLATGQLRLLKLRVIVA